MKRSDPAPHDTSSYRVKALPVGFAQFFLEREQVKIYRRFAELLQPRPEWRVLDLGVNGAPEVEGDSFFEKLYPYRSAIVAAGVEAPGPFEAVFPDVKYVQVKRGEPLPFETGSFDLVFCNAVIEHVGTREQQRAFLAEICRVGRRAFVTTPNRWYPGEFHTVTPLLHYLPPPVYRRVYRTLGLEFFSHEENLNLLDERAFRALVPPDVKASMHAHRFLGLRSNFFLVIGEALDRS